MLELLASAFLSIPLIGAFALLALGIVAIYRASRVLNLAHGAMAMLPAYVHYTLVQSGLAPLVSLPVAVVTGALLGVGVERLFVRRLRPQGPTAQTVGTIAVTGLVIAVVARVWGTTPIVVDAGQRVLPGGELAIGDIAIRVGEVGLLVVAALVSAITFAFFRLTDYGLAMRGAAQNRAAASLMGIDPDRAASAAWALGGGLAAVAGVLLADVTTLDPFSLSLQMLPAFVAALIGGFESLVGAVVGAVVVGLAFGLVPILSQVPVVDAVFVQTGAPQLTLTVLALVVMAVRGRRVVGVEAAEAGLTGGLTQRRARDPGDVAPVVLIALALLVLWPFVAPFSMLGSTLLAFELALAGISLVVLTGWVGQISLAQATFVGVGALVSALMARDVGIGFPFSAVVGVVVAGLVAVGLGAVAMRVRGLYLAVATLIFAWMGQSFLFRSAWLGVQGGSSTIEGERLGLPGGYPSFDLSTRKPIYFIMLAAVVLAVAALANLRDTRTGRAFFAVRGSEMAAASLGIDVTRTKLVAFAIGGVLAGLSGTLLMYEQRSVVPDQFFVTASLQVLAIAVVGGLTSLGGAVAAATLFAGLNEVFFRVEALGGLLDLVSAGLLAVVLLAAPGGLAALPRALRRRFGRPSEPAQPARHKAAARPASRAPEARPAQDEPAADAAPGEPAVAAGAGSPDARQPALFRPAPAPEPATTAAAAPAQVEAADAAPDGTAADGDTPGDDGQAPGDETIEIPAVDDAGEEATEGEPAADGRRRRRRERIVPAGDWLAEDDDERPPLPAARDERRPLILAEDVTVRFGGLTAVDAVTLAVHEGEVVGLIGPNGAGKTTLFNAILGLNDPAAGTIRLHGRDAADLSPHLRARLGVGRTFQVLQLFNELTAFDNLLVATHLHNDAGVLSNLIAGPRTLEAERRVRDRVHRVLDLLDLEEVADAPVRDLPFGMLRMVELGRALVTGATVLMLDEAASGLNDAETDRLVEVVRHVRDLGVTVLLIEHDVRMVTGVSDHVYVLDQGQVIADGPPAAIQRDPKVIEAYLGAADVDEPADGRSDGSTDQPSPAGVVS